MNRNIYLLRDVPKYDHLIAGWLLRVTSQVLSSYTDAGVKKVKIPDLDNSYLVRQMRLDPVEAPHLV